MGVLATKGTLSSELFALTSKKFENTTFVEVEGEGLVEIVENGNLEAATPLLEKYLHQMLAKNVDSIVLGCTHYPMLIPIIKKILPPHIALIDSGVAVAKQTKNVLEINDLLNKNHQANENLIYTNGNNKGVLNAVVNHLQITQAKVFSLDF